MRMQLTVIVPIVDAAISSGIGKSVAEVMLWDDFSATLEGRWEELSSARMLGPVLRDLQVRITMHD